MNNGSVKLENGSTLASANSLVKTNYTHEAMIDYLITNPACTQREIAEHFGYSIQWINKVINSDAFNVVLSARKEKMVNPLVASITENLNLVARKSMERVSDKLDGPHTLEDAIKAMEVATKALGYGTAKTDIKVSNSNYVVQLPPVSKTSEEWVASYAPKLIESEE